MTEFSENIVDHDGIEVDLSRLFNMFKKNFRFIMLSTICITMLSTLYTIFFIPKKYASEATIFLTPKVNDNGYIETSSINSNTYLINTYISIIKGDSILTGVAEKIGNGLNVNQIKSTLSVSNDMDTQIIRIKSTTTNPKLSKEIVETIVNQFSSDILEKLNIQNISIIDYAKINENPVSPNKLKNALKGAMVGFTFSAGIVIIKFLLDNRLRNKNEAENYLGIPVLAEIPWFED